MGQKGSKVRDILRRSPASSGSSPLNNATYWEAEEDPEWDNCVMVVANQKGRQNIPGSEDSLARSLHKDVDYPAINVSRRSPDHRDIPLSPDSRYPSPTAPAHSGNRKRQNTLLDTGWHTCFKNNNYVFVRNGSGTRPDRQYGDKVKETNSDITFVIATTDPEKEVLEQKLIVSLKDPSPKIKECSPPAPLKETAVANENAKVTPDSNGENSSGKKSKKSERKKSNWLKKLTPGRSKLKVDGTPEERAPIYESSPDESPESKENQSPPKEIKTIRIDPSPIETPVKAIDLIGSGPHTSTPKVMPETGKKYKSLPRNGTRPTPHRPHDGKLTVRRRLPYDETSEGNQSLFQVSPLSKHGNGSHVSPQMNLDLSPLEKRANCHRRIIESPKFQNRLHPSDSMSDIPFADSVEEEIPYDERPQPKMSKKDSPDLVEDVFFDEEPKPKCNSVDFSAMISFDDTTNCKESRENVTDFSVNVSFDEKPKTLVDRGSQVDLTDELFLEKPIQKISRGNQSDFCEDISFDERPRPRITRIKTRDRPENVSFDEPPRRKITRSSTVKVKSAYRERCLSEPVDEKSLGNIPELKSLSDQSTEEKSIFSSEPSLKIRRSMSCREVQKPASPMEEEENRSLDWHAVQMKSPDDATVTFSPYRLKEDPPRENPVTAWLKDLRLITESECLNALQAKEIIKEDWIANALAVGNAQEKAERIWDLGSLVTKYVEEMLESLKKPKLSSTPFSLKVAQFCSSLLELLKMGTSAEQQISLVEARIKKSCSLLLDALNRDEEIDLWKTKMISELQVVQESIRAIVKQLLQKEMRVIVDCLDVATNINSLKRSVFAIILLGRLDPTFCHIAVQLGAVRSLLAVVVEPKWKEMHPCALRGLTVLSCVPAAIKSFEESNGVEYVCDVLCEEQSTEGSRSEAAGLVAQITAPWTEGSGYALQSINQNAQRLVQSIASLASKTESSEVFLLSTAALANLSFADDVLKTMKENKVLNILVAACRNSPHAASLFIKDQVATVLANMAAKEEYRTDLTSGGGLVLLMCFLQLRPSVGHGAPQLAACERIQQKAAIALARLCANPETSNIVADMQGIQRLVKLVKDRKERNDSDSVLVACLAALRKIAAVRQKEEFKKLGAQELVENRLWDAFLAHSSKRESYV